MWSLFQVKKLQERVEKCRRDVESTKGKYEEALNDINSYNAKYMEDMTEVCKVYRVISAFISIYGLLYLP